MILEFLRKQKFIGLPAFSKVVVGAVEFVEPLLPSLAAIYDQLADDDSRDILIKVLAYRALGYQKVKLPLNVPQYWAGIKKVEALADSSNSIPIQFVESKVNGRLSLFDLKPIGIPIIQYSLPFFTYNEFVADQYRCISGQTIIGVDEGDIVMDVGGCWGDTALHFAHEAGAAGKVFSYEFAPINLEVFRKNLDLNPQLKDRIDVIEFAAWSDSHRLLNFEENGPATHMASDNVKEGGVETLSIDDLVESRRIPRVDFIKMDIEGSEKKALQGAANTIKKFRPELAISIYHRLPDFVEIPEFLLSLNVGYRLFIRHFTIYDEETVLFAKVVEL